MLGKNPIREIVKGDGRMLEVKEIYATLQGEGPFTGHPAVFISLGGCNLACNFCDVNFENFTSMTLDDLLIETVKIARNEEGTSVRRLAVITGGEPMRQPIELLCEKLVHYGFTVQIETNGTIYRDLHPEVKIVCSPKNTGNGFVQIIDDLLRRINAFKFVVSQDHNLYNFVPEVSQSVYDIPVYVQPMDEGNIIKNLNNLQYSLDLSKKHGYYYSMQTHKVLGIN